MLHDIVGILSENHVDLVVGVLIGGHTVEGDTKLVGNESAEVGNQSEDTDAASDGGRFGEDIVGRRTDPVAA